MYITPTVADLREAFRKQKTVNWKRYNWLKSQREKQLKEIEDLRSNIALKQKLLRIINRQIGKELGK